MKITSLGPLGSMVLLCHNGVPGVKCGVSFLHLVDVEELIVVSLVLVDGGKFEVCFARSVGVDLVLRLFPDWVLDIFARPAHVGLSCYNAPTQQPTLIKFPVSTRMLSFPVGTKWSPTSFTPTIVLPVLKLGQFMFSVPS